MSLPFLLSYQNLHVGKTSSVLTFGIYPLVRVASSFQIEVGFVVVCEELLFVNKILKKVNESVAGSS